MSTNHALKDAIASAGLGSDGLAERIGVDPKTVSRWVSDGRVPHRPRQHEVAEVLGTPTTRLWPGESHFPPDLTAVYSHRGLMSNHVWRDLIDSAETVIDVCAYAAMYLPDNNLIDNLAAAADRSVSVRIALADPDSAVVAERGAEEGIGDNLAGRIRLGLGYFADIADNPGIELRLHATPLYTSILRFDDVVLANMQLYGAGAKGSPVMRIDLSERNGDSLGAAVLEAFERVWMTATEYRRG